MNVRAVGEAAGASVEPVLGKIGDAVTMAALDSALAPGLARHGGGTSSRSIVNADAGSVTHRSIRTTTPSILSRSFMDTIRSHLSRLCAVLIQTDRLEVIFSGTGSHPEEDYTDPVQQKP
ncbi:hypothetical protein [Microbacterium sp. ZXX196]|uniref:hypothetical protein n=1 Tax=Microbacterium sp. ZXX196 TaxID=2609291 RepID=UPI0012B82F0E|nr:hypothetical protein [Microbacterium sp. ZXX196]MTE24724.1 hypothetical protein [Microbacterium sp. ZXX196]